MSAAISGPLLPPVFCRVQENLEITFVRSHRLAARVIRFDVSFLNVHIGYEMIHSGRYDESIEDFGFIPLNAFYECPDGVPPFLPLSRDGFLRMQDLFDAFGAALASRNDPRWSCWTRLHLLMILELVHRCYTAAVGQRTAGFDLQAPHVWVSLLLEYIHSHYAESLSLDALSQYIHVNKTSLTKEFKAVVGCSVSEYIQLYRFQCACLGPFHHRYSRRGYRRAMRVFKRGLLCPAVPAGHGDDTVGIP